MLTIKRFFTYSLLLHAAILIAALSFVPPVKGKRGEEFFASIVSPEEVLVSRPSAPVLRGARSTPRVQPKAVIPAPEREGNIPALPEREISSSKSPSPAASPNTAKESSPERKGTVQRPVGPELSIREKLFDKSIIGDLTKREIRKADEGEEERKFTFDIKELKYLGYLMRLKEKIEAIWIYPPDALSHGIYGDLVIKFTIKKNGRLGAVELIRTSGHKNLDSAALKALRDAEPFWPLPDDWGVETYIIEGHFIYSIYGYYVR